MPHSRSFAAGSLAAADRVLGASPGKWKSTLRRPIAAPSPHSRSVAAGSRGFALSAFGALGRRG